jgi:hypothetical protein
MAYGSEGGENVRFKHKKINFCFKIYIYMLVKKNSVQRPFVEL